MIICPKCSFEQPGTGAECMRCGVIFAKWQEKVDFPIVPRPTVIDEEDELPGDGKVGRGEVGVLGVGLIMAIAAYAIPVTRYIFSLLVTLFHELGHAVAGWLLGYPSIPAFDFIYGGGMTHQGIFRISIALAVAGLFGWAIWHFRENRTTMALIGALFLVWLFFVTAEWRRELVIAAAGHMAELILAGIFFYKALAGVGWRIPEIERPLGAFAAFFVQIHSMAFAWRLTRDPDFLSWYREGKGGALMNDLEVVALDLQIHTPLSPGIIGTARGLLIFSAVPVAIALIWYFQRARWHRVLRALRTADV